MPTLRPSLVGGISLMLVGSLAGGAFAQSDDGPPDPMAPSHFTGTWSEDLDVSGMEEWEWSSGADYFESLGNESIALMDATDPRLDGVFTQVLGIRSFPIDEATGDYAPVWTASVRIENAEGAWSGTFDGFGGEAEGREWYHLDGEGAHEGLYVMMRWLGEDESYEGVVVPGVPPDYPEPIEPDASPAYLTADETPSEDAVAGEAEDEPEAEAEPEAVSDTDEEDGDLSGVATYIDGVRIWQDGVGDTTVYQIEMSDPRANGTFTELAPTGRGYGSGSTDPAVAGILEVEIVNDAGSWSGLENGVWHPEMGWHITAWLAGAGAYEGLTLYLHAHRDVYSTPRMRFEGVIFEGEAPHMLTAVELPAE